jgi:hypothetical protein
VILVTNENRYLQRQWREWALARPVALAPRDSTGCCLSSGTQGVGFVAGFPGGFLAGWLVDRPSDQLDREQQIRRVREVLSGAGWLFDDFVNNEMRKVLVSQPDRARPA